MQNDRRNPYRAFKPGLISDYLGKRKVLSAERFSLGKNNTSYKLKLSDGEVCVARLYASSHAGREGYLMRFAAGLAPVPEELYSGDDWAIFSFMPGQSLSDVPEYTGIAAKIITHLVSRTFQSAGDIQPDGTVSAFPFGGISDYIFQQLNAAEVQAWLGKRGIDEMMEIVNRLLPEYRDMESHAYLVHGDFNPSNILINNKTVSAVLDWEYCHAGTPYMDLGNLLRHTPPRYHRDIESAIAAGNNGLMADWLRRSKMVDLVSHLEFLSSGRSDAFKQECVGRVNDFIHYFGRDI